MSRYGSLPSLRDSKLINFVLQLQPLFAIPIYFSVLTGNPPLPVSLLIAIIPICLRFWLFRYGFRKTPFDLPVLLLSAGMLIGSLVTPDKQVALGALSSSFASISIYYSLVDNGQRSVKYLFWSGIVICIITILMAAWFFSQGDSRKVFFNQWVFDLFTWLPKSEGPVLQWNSLGALVCVIIPPLFGIAFFQNRRSIRAGALALGLFFAVVLFLSASGGGWIASAIGLAFVFVCWRRWILSVIIPVYGILAAFAYIYYGKYHWLSAVFSVNSLSSRFEIWRNTLHLFTLKIYYPFTGLGLGSVNNLYNSQFGRNINHTHNSYLQLYADTGILGLLGLTIAVVIFIRMSRAILSAPKQNTCYGAGIGLIGGIISYAAFALFDVTTMVPVTVDARYIYMSVPLLCLIAALFTGVYFLCRKPS